MTALEKTSRDRVLLMISNRVNESLLREELKRNYTIVEYEGSEMLKGELSWDIIITDGVMLKSNYNELVQLRSRVFPQFIPVLLLTLKQDLSLAEKALHDVVDELIRLPIERVELQARLAVLSRIRLYNKILAEQTYLDPLTGAYNRRLVADIADKLVSRFHRDHRPFSLLAIDIDNFKKVNDNFGHLAGDSVLRGIVSVIKSLVRKHDFICRCGGEEFAVLLDNTDLHKAERTAERIRAAVEQTQFDIGNGQPVTVTVSIGVSAMKKGFKDIRDLMELADRALYEAKRRGKNTVVSM
ncbi:diguanylate cyclase [Coprothermobacteraceae bacterium]|nr:diguanylate cyclase [Coprothermobacteraceae bacterium]